MPHDVFISHSVRDEPYADAVCAKLESRAIRCWIAPRDIRPGMSWGSSIIEAIDGARVMLLVFSSHANGSPQISREVERAVNKGLVVIPVRVEDVKPSGDLEYFLGTPHWLDAITPPFERHVDGIADSAKFWLERLESARASSGTERPPQSVGAEPPVAPAAGPGSIQPDASNAPAPKVTAEAASRSCPKCAREIPAAAMVCPYCRVNLKQAAATPGKRRSWLIAAAGLAVACAAAFAGVYHYETIYLPRHQAEEQRRHTFRDCEGCPEMVVVPSGSFTMGDDTDTPTHHVTIGQSFAAGKYPVTRDQYARFVKATGHSNDEWKKPGIPQTGRDPVVNVNWNDAQAYVGWLKTRTGKNYRLLSEAEYEYAERAGTTTRYWWGDDGDEACSHACYSGKACGHNSTVPVGSYPANGFGLYDMVGDVWEWTEDCWNDSYAGAPDDGTAWTSGDCGRRVMRGGSWDNDYRSALQSAFRAGPVTGLRYDGNGFRVARTL